MITDFDAFVTWMFVIIDDIWQEIAPVYSRPELLPRCSDSERITMTIVGECREWDRTHAVARLCAIPACGKPYRMALGSVRNA